MHAVHRNQSYFTAATQSISDHCSSAASVPSIQRMQAPHRTAPRHLTAATWLPSSTICSKTTNSMGQEYPLKEKQKTEQITTTKTQQPPQKNSQTTSAHG